MVLLTESAIYTFLALIATVCISIYYYFQYRFNYWKNLGVPYIEPQFPYGNYGDNFKANRQIGIIVTEFYNEMKSKGHKFFGTYFLFNPTLILTDAELVKSVMARDFGHFYDRGVYHDKENDPLSATLFSMEGQSWKNLRARITPTFTSGKMKKMFQTLVDCSVELKDCLNEPIRKSEPVDIKKILVQYTTDVIGSCAFGIECNSFKNDDTEFIRSGKAIFKPAGFDRFKLFFAFTMPSLAKFFKLRITNKDVDRFYRNLVKDTIEYREKNNITRHDFMQLMMQLKNVGYIEVEEDDEQDNDYEHKDHKILKEHKEITHKLTLDELSAQAFIFFIAGFETSSTSLQWTFYELAQNQNIQNKMREEIVRVLKKHDGKITYDAINEMHYMERVVQESLRKHPPLMFIQRVVTTDYTIPDTDIVLKKGTTVFIPNHGLQMDPEFYPEPEKFDPDRFLEENKNTRPDYTWLPFGDGPRVCIGLRFGMMQMKVGLSQLLLNYKFTLNPKTVTPPVLDPVSFIATAKDTIWLNAERVNN